jgi:hypothetical protein
MGINFRKYIRSLWRTAADVAKFWPYFQYEEAERPPTHEILHFHIITNFIKELSDFINLN